MGSERSGSRASGSLLLLVGLVLAPVVSMLLIWNLLDRQNAIANEERARQAVGIAEFLLESRTYTVVDYGVWDDLYRKTVIEGDFGWFDADVGAGQGIRLGRNATLLLDAEARPVAGSWEDRRVLWSPERVFGPDFEAFFAGLRDETPAGDGRSVFMKAGRELAILSLVEAQPHSPGKISLVPGVRRFLLFVEVFTPDVIDGLRRTLSWGDLDLATTAPAGPNVTLPGLDGEVAGYMSWEDPRHGREALLSMLPLLGGLLAFSGSAVIGWLVICRGNSRLMRAERDARSLADRDPLTGVANRRALAAEIERLAGAGDVQAILIDLDGFKAVNDRLGHKLGDALLVETTVRLQAQLPAGALLARMGGDEFAVILSASDAEAEELAYDLILALHVPFRLSGQVVSVSASLGLAAARPEMSSDELLRRADLAMYEAKRTGSGLVRRFHAGLDQERRLVQGLDAEMREGLARGEFWVAFQPIHSHAAGGVVSVEALARWDHPIRGAVSPGIFVPIAERSRFILQLGEFVLREACARIAAAESDIAVAVNLSPVQLLDDGLVERIAAILDETGLAPERLELEITEGYLVEQEERAVGVLTRLRALGVRISLDDFGCGYASVGYLRKFPLDKVKIDRSFIGPVGADPKAQQIVTAVVALCRAFGTEVVAEGVETESQAAFLQGIGCDELQGYFYGRPVRSLPSAFTEARSGLGAG